MKYILLSLIVPLILFAQASYSMPWDIGVASTAIYCNPLIVPKQMCPPGNIACPDCGSNKCLCPTTDTTPLPDPTPTPTPTPLPNPTPTVYCNPLTVPKQMCPPGNVACPDCGSNRCACPVSGNPNPTPLPTPNPTPTPTPSGKNHTIYFTNKCPYDIWVGAAGKDPSVIVGNNGGWALASGNSNSITLPFFMESVRFWGRTGCNFNSAGLGPCDTGSCIHMGRTPATSSLQCAGAGGGVPPVTLIEATFGAGANGVDYYDISNVDGFNIPVSMTPVAGTWQHDKSPSDPLYKYDCVMSSCLTNINNVCPPELRLLNEYQQIVGCKSACLAYNNDEYCCKGTFNNPKTCPATQYAKIFKNACPDAYSYAYDDSTSTYTCRNGDYNIEFCS